MARQSACWLPVWHVRKGSNQRNPLIARGNPSATGLFSEPIQLIARTNHRFPIDQRNKLRGFGCLPSRLVFDRIFRSSALITQRSPILVHAVDFSVGRRSARRGRRFSRLSPPIIFFAGFGVDAIERFLVAVEDKQVAVVEERNAHVAGDATGFSVTLPGEAVAVTSPCPPSVIAMTGPPLGAPGEDQAVFGIDGGRRHQSPVV